MHGKYGSLNANMASDMNSFRLETKNRAWQKQRQVGMLESLLNSPQRNTWHVNSTNSKKKCFCNYSCQEHGHRMYRSLAIHMEKLNLLLTC